ncbi:Arginine biosynthesis bifunctional protein ArgJ [Roseimaritima multifibrata]|uniref:Arginine biosynthesis bifunctional protein ArgJ n=1 Tax=Roseimaritima multifibrata TaxID=1930274 RepID=A0A517MH23_9BACT|nr:bifunctional glutamate N-acetyltransferase/amino-acid acetyltransferase ArgJ [Roseimaritima multifibrata]QDS94182.1 Arginine biosynthesis bifunctional protein ArgJ [Roseimaritima multifibrata]
MSTAVQADDLPTGYRYAGVTCGIKKSGRPDLALIVSDRPAVAAAVYTTNQVVAAPVVLSRSRTPSANVRAVVINSGNANACTGEQGDRDAAQMTQWAADAIDADVQSVLVMSTGIIGHPMPMAKIQSGVTAAGDVLSHGADGFQAAADAILTTDQGRKVAAVDFKIGTHRYRIVGMAKGAGMIAPNMATMLATITTDAPLTTADAQQSLSVACDRSFNRVSVDGHTSTNDTVVLLAANEAETLSGDDFAAFQAALESLCIQLAKQLPADGEGALRIMHLSVRGAQSTDDAEQIARVVCASPLVKTAITGGDPNWGRIVSAAGYAGPKIEVNKTCLSILGQAVFEAGQPLKFDAAALSKAMKDSKSVKLDLTVGSGSGEAEFWASDLTNAYVDFNSLYTT